MKHDLSGDTYKHVKEIHAELYDKDMIDLKILSQEGYIYISDLG